LLSQISQLVKNFERPLLIVEGSENIFSIRNVHPNAIRGMIASITVDFRVPIIYTKDPNDTAETIMSIARREQDFKHNDVPLNLSKKTMSEKERKEFIISSLPSVGPIMAKELLKKFGSVKGVINADVEELQEVDKIGKTVGSKIRTLLDEDYNSKD